MVDAMKSSVPGRELGALGRGDAPVPMAAPSAPVRRREANGRRGPAPPGHDVRKRPGPPDRAAGHARAWHQPSRLAIVEREPTRDDVDALVGPATPHFAYQLRARVRELVAGLPEDHDGPPLRRGKDGATRPAGLRILEGRGGRARATQPAGLGAAPEHCAGATTRCRVRGSARLRHRRLARDRPRDRTSLRPRRRRAGRDRLPPQRQGRRGDGRGAARGGGRAGARPRQRHLRPRARRGRCARRRSTCSSTTRRRASSAPRSRPRTSTGTGR